MKEKDLAETKRNVSFFTVLLIDFVWFSACSRQTFTCSKSTICSKCEICSKLTIKSTERRQWPRFGVFVVNFEHISHLFLVSLLFTLNKEMLAGLLHCKVQKFL